MNERTTIDERIELVDEAKFTDFLSENEIYERQCMIFTVIASFSLLCATMILLKEFKLFA